MISPLLKPNSKKLTLFLSIFLGVNLLLGIGFFIGWKSNSFNFIHSSNTLVQKVDAPINSNISFEDVMISEAFKLTLFLSVVCAILLCWTFILLIKSRKDKKLVEASYKSLKNELELGQKASQDLHITHQQLLNTSGQLDGIIQGTTDYISTIDLNYRFISFNDSYAYAMENLFGIKLELGMKVEEAYENSLVENSMERWTRALSGETFSANQEITFSLDITYYFETTYTPIHNDKGEITGATQICKDVTDRILTAEKLKREKDFVSAIFNVNSSLIMVLDREGRIIRFNESCENKSGYTETEIKGRVFWNILVPTHLISKVKYIYQNLHLVDFSKDFITELITKNEEIINISWRISPIKDETGSNEFIVATGIDITEKIDSQMAQQRMLEILENSSDLIRISDLHGRITYLNPAGRKMLGLEKDTDIKNLKINSCHPKWANQLMREVGFPAATKNGSWLGETAITTFDGKEIPTSQLILSHSNNTGELDFYSTVVRDTSSQKSLEIDLENARDSAVETTNLMSSFLANMSHEIRTPMNGIIGLAELLQMTQLDTQQEDYVETIQYSGDTLLTIINDILDFSKLKAGKLQFVKEDFDLYTMVESTIELFAIPLHKKDIELCYIIDPKVPTKLLGDQGRVRQILVNLISNAIKFTEKGEIVVSIKANKLDNNPIIHFSIKDSGIGIAKLDQKKLFSAFTQADASIANSFGGTGLGLAISKQLVDMMNGEIGVKSEKNKGSTFWFTAQFESPKIESNRLIRNNSLQNIQTLIVEKNDVNRNVLLSQTKSWGMYSDETNSGKKALKLMKTAASNGEPFEILILGETIENASGLQLAEQINKDTTLRKTKIIHLYSDKNINIIEKAKLVGVEYLIKKPIRQTELLKTLNYMLSDKYALKSEERLLETLDELIVSKNTLEKGASTMNLESQKNDRILIAEDNLVNQKVILNQVTGLGYEVDLAENGREVLDALQLKDYSLILMDCQMPIMDGFDATKSIRKSEMGTADHIPIIAVTAHAIEGDREKCLDIGMDDYISKPTKQQVLADAINLWLNKSDRQSSSDEIITKSPVLPKTEPALSEQESIDFRLAELEENCGTEIVLECIHLFLEDTANVVKELINSQEVSDFSQLAKDAHKLKGSSANMGSSRMPKLCQKLIEYSIKEQPMSTEIILKQISDEYAFLNTIYLIKQQKLEESLNQIVSA